MKTTPDYHKEFGKTESRQDEQTNVITDEMLNTFVLDLKLLISTII